MYVSKGLANIPCWSTMHKTLQSSNSNIDKAKSKTKCKRIFSMPKKRFYLKKKKSVLSPLV